MSAKTLWIMVGCPGAGKSYFAKNHLIRNNLWKYVSRDEIRFALLNSGDEYFSKERQVFKEFCEKISINLLDNIHTDVIADATHLNEKSRNKLLYNLKNYGIDFTKIDVIPVYVKASFATIQQRNSEREGRARVPYHNLCDMYDALQHPNEDNFKYTAILEVDNS